MKTSRATWVVPLTVAALAVTVPAVHGDDGRPSSAPTVRISKDGRALEIKRSSDAKAVRVEVLDRCGDPVPGPPKIRRARVENEMVIATYGKHCWATITLESLAIECAGCD